MKKYLFESEAFARGFLANSDKIMEERIACGLLEAAGHLTVRFPDNCLLPTVNAHPDDSAIDYSFRSGIDFDAYLYIQLNEKYPERMSELEEIKNEMLKYNTYNIIKRLTDDKLFEFSKADVCWGGGWGGHGNPNFGKLPALGTEAIRAEIATYRAINPEKDGFYNACKTAMDALDAVGDRVRVKALEEAENSENAGRKAELVKIADTFSRIPKKPAENFYEAIMDFWMLYSYDGIDSPGRFDQYMIDFYRKSPESERLDLLRRFLEAMHNERGWNLCISGSDEKWNDETNELSYDILQMVTALGYQTPNLTMRVHRNTPEKLWEMAVKCIGTGIGLPAIYNDEVVCPALEKIGIPPCDSHDYCMNGCNQIDIMGKSHMGLEDGEVNLGKVLELALHNGYDMKNGNQLSKAFGDPCDCTSFEEFYNLYDLQMKYVTDVAVMLSNASQQAYAEFAPHPIRSCLVEGCLEKGRDFKHGGPLYGFGQILAEGIADTADSLYAIKKLVFDEKKYTMKELITALEKNYEGYDELYHDFAGCEKFGNDIPKTDEIAVKITDDFFTYLKTKKTFRGGQCYTGGCSPFSRAAKNGMAVAALPNGKHLGESNYADSIAATPGCDTHGPTAALKSMMRYKQEEACSGLVTQMKFDKTLFNSVKGQESFITIAKVYFANGGQQLAVNVLDRDTLLCAQKEPYKYKNLIVRVGGYSDYFCNLSPELQQNVIDRSEFVI